MAHRVRDVGSFELKVDAFPATNYLKRMAILPLVILPDPILRQASKPVERVDAPLKKLIADMVETMHDAPGIGLAAVQIGEPLRLLVVDLAGKDEPPDPKAFINPAIVQSSDERATYEEGCLSIPDYYAEVQRPASVRVTYTDESGAPKEVQADGLLATVLQHEIDHLNGVLFIDHISKLKRDMVVRRFKKLSRDKPAPSRLAS